MFKSTSYIIFISFILITISIVFAFMIDYQMVMITRQELNSSLTASGMAGFSALSLEEMAVRNDISVIDRRNIILDKSEAKIITEKYIYKNLKLKSNGIAENESVISDKVTPVTFDITVNNSGDNGYKYTTIVIEAMIPFKFSHSFGMVAKKTIEVDYSTFLIDSQK